MKISKLNLLILAKTLDSYTFLDWLRSEPRYKRLATLLTLHTIKLTCLLYKEREYIPILDKYIVGINTRKYKKAYSACLRKSTDILQFRWYFNSKYKDIPNYKEIVNDLYSKEMYRCINRYVKE